MQTSYMGGSVPAWFAFLSVSPCSGLRALSVHLLPLPGHIWFLRPAFCQGVKALIKHHLVQQLVNYTACPGETTSASSMQNTDSIKSSGQLLACFDSQKTDC